MTGLIQRLATEQAKRNHDAIEAMCERMLTTPGDYGVLVASRPDGTVLAELTRDVPFGQVHYIRIAREADDRG